MSMAVLSRSSRNMNRCGAVEGIAVVVIAAVAAVVVVVVVVVAREVMKYRRNSRSRSQDSFYGEAKRRNSLHNSCLQLAYVTAR